ncbi:MAG TPA: MarC family protein [Thiolinea sp.]|nr:MarC family protein [Thiolinea sp.]
MPSLDTLINAFVTLFVTIDPVSTAPIFLGLTAGMARQARRTVVLRGVLVAALILLLFAFAGSGILNTLGITIEAFRVAGGLLLFYTAFEMLYAKRQERQVQLSEAALRDHIANLAVFPLAIPLLAGPGAISATILLASQLAESAGYWAGVGLLSLIILLLMSIAAATLMTAEIVDKYLGNTGRMILTRLLGVLLAALSVQYVADGVHGLIAGN